MNLNKENFYTILAVFFVLSLTLSAVAFVGLSEGSSESTSKKETGTTVVTDSTSATVLTKYEEEGDTHGVTGYTTLSDRTYFYFSFSDLTGESAAVVYPSRCISYSGCEVTFMYSYDKVTWYNMVTNDSDSLRTEPHEGRTYIAYTVVQNCGNPYLLYRDFLSNYLTGYNGVAWQAENYYTAIVTDTDGDGIYGESGDTVLG